MRSPDIARDGMLQGINWDGTIALATSAGATDVSLTLPSVMAVMICGVRAVNPALSSAAAVAGTGPIPMTFGCTPAIACSIVERCS